MNEPLDLVQLRSFVAIADCGGFGRAAAALHFSQPTISQHVRLLERRLGTALVERDGRRMRFTKAGERLLVEARRIIAVHDESLQRLQAAAAPTVVIGSTETAAEPVLTSLLATLRDAFSRHVVQFHIDRSTALAEAVARGAIDLALVLGLGAETPGRRVGVLPLRWYAGPGWSAPTSEEVWPLVAYAQPCVVRQRALQALGEAGRRVAIAAESTCLEGVIAAARAGLGLAALPNLSVAPDGLVVVDGLPELGAIDVNLVVRRGLDPEVEATAHQALEAFFAARALLAVSG